LGLFVYYKASAEAVELAAPAVVMYESVDLLQLFEETRGRKVYDDRA